MSAHVFNLLAFKEPAKFIKNAICLVLCCILLLTFFKFNNTGAQNVRFYLSYEIASIMKLSIMVIILRGYYDILLKLIYC